MKKFVAFGSILLAAATLSCNRSDDDNNCKAGTGGNLTIVAFPQHHLKPISSKESYLDTVFVKFNAQDAPSDNVYDTYFVGKTGEDHVHLQGLQCGQYYFFATGYDTSIHQRVVGGIPFSTDKKDGEVNLAIPVTEGD